MLLAQMILRFTSLIPWIVGLLVALSAHDATAQCIRMRDPRNGNQLTLRPRTNFACLTANAPRNATVLRIDFESAVRNVVINWGDGTPVQNLAGPATSVTHTWPDTGTFTYRITQPNCATVIEGTFINNYNTSTPGIGFVFPPAGTDNRRCLPVTLGIRNLSPGMNAFTTFIINWGGQEKPDTVDARSYDETILHTYEPGNRLCRTRMTVTFRNLCGATPGQQPLSQSAGDYFFIEKDSAMTSPQKIVMCAPAELTINDASKLNCLDTSGRRISWQGTRGFAGGIGAPANGAFVSYNVPANKRLQIPASAFTPAPADSTYQVKMFLSNRCGTDTATIDILMAQPKTPSLAVVNPTVCPGEVMRFTNNTVINYPDGIVQFEWDWGDGSPVEVNNDPTVEHTYTIGGNYTVRLTCRVLTTVPGQACSRFRDLPVSVRRTVSPIVSANPGVLCNNGVATFKNRSVNTQQVVWGGWELNAPGLAAGNGFLPALQPGQDTSVVALRNVNPADSSFQLAFKRHGRYTVRLKAQSGTCPQVAGSFEMNVWPTPALRWRASTRRVCVGAPFQIRDSSVVFATDSNGLPSNFRNLTWQLHMGDTTRYRSAAPVADNFDSPGRSNRITTHTYTQPGIYKVALTVWVGDRDCPQTDTIIVQALPAVRPTFAVTRNRCDNMRVRFTNTTADSATFYAFEARRGAQLAARFVRQDRQAFDALLPYVPPGDSTYYQVTLFAYTVAGADTCITSSPMRRLGIAPTPVANFSMSQADGCSPIVGVTFNNASFNLPVDTSNRYFWRLGSSTTSRLENPAPQDFINNTPVLRKDTIFFTITRRDGCAYSASRELFVFPNPSVQMTAPDSLCSGVPAQLSATGNNLSQYTWSFADYDQSTVFDARPAKVFVNFTGQPRIYNIDLTARTVYNCVQTVSRPIKVFPQPQVEIGSQLTADNHCSPAQVRFSYANVSGASQFKWFFGGQDSAIFNADTAFNRTFTNTTASPVQQSIQMVATNGGACSTRVSRTITINPEVRASFNLNTTQGCHPLATVATNSSTIGGDQLTWSVGSQVIRNQTFVQQVLTNVSAVRDTTIPVQLVVRNTAAPACIDTAIRQVRVFAKPRVDGVSVPSAVGCSPMVARLSSSGLGIEEFYWSFGDGLDSTERTGSLSHLYENYNPTADRNYTVTVVGRNSRGCADTAQRVLTVKPFVQAGIITQDTVGCSPFTARFSSAGSINANRYDWVFGTQATSNANNPIVTLVNGADTVLTVPVRLVAQKTQVGACPDTTLINVRVLPKPRADFELSNNIGCGPLAVRLRNTSLRTASFYWIISSGGVSDTIRNRAVLDTVISNPNLVNKSVIVDLVAFSAQGCTDTKRDFITVYADVTADFELDTVGCSPHLVTITNRSSNNGGSWLWNFGDGNSSSVRNPTHEFNFRGGAGDTTYWVSLTSISSIGGCRRTDSVPVRVYGRPVNNFRITTATAPFNQIRRLQLPDRVLRIENRNAYRPEWNYRWLFGDGTVDTSRAAAFTHTYNFQNQDFLDTNFVITQIAFNAFGCSDTLREQMIIQPEPPVPDFTWSDSIGCAPFQVAFYNRSSYGREYLWEFSDRGITSERDPVRVFNRPGKYTVKLTVSGFGGVRSITKDTIIEVQDFGSALFVTNPRSGLEVIIPEQAVDFRPLYPCQTCSYKWDFGDGNTSTEMTPKHKYTEANTWDVSLTVTSPNGCVNSDTLRAAVLTVKKQLISCPSALAPSKNGPSGGYLDPSIPTNAIFYPYTQGMVKMTMWIFNRWGQLVYQSNELNRGWDGYLNGRIASQDTYVYRITAEFGTGETKTLLGDLTVVH